MVQDFESPSKLRLWAVQIGGVVSAIAIISSLQSIPTAPKVEQSDLSSTEITLLSQTLTLTQPKAEVLTVQPMAQADIQLARQAWQYFQHNWNQKTGLVNGQDGVAIVTMADQTAAIAALISAREFEFISEPEFADRMNQLLKTLATMPLYAGVLPNRQYNAKTGSPIASQGWSVLEIGRLARWLKVIEFKYPQWKAQTREIWNHWHTQELVENGALMSEESQQKYPDGRLGYESYAAYGLKLWGLPAVLDTKSHVMKMKLQEQHIPYDSRASSAKVPNAVVSDPYLLDGIETGFQALPKSYADRILAAQIARYQSTQQLTAIAQDKLDRAPFSLTNTLMWERQAWAAMSGQQAYPDFRSISTKAAIGWHVLYQTKYTQKLVDAIAPLNSDRGWYSGYYETLHQPNRSLTAETNGFILASCLYRKVGKPLLKWAGVPDLK